MNEIKKFLAPNDRLKSPSEENKYISFRCFQGGRNQLKIFALTRLGKLLRFEPSQFIINRRYF